MARIFARRKPTVTAAVQPVRDPAKAFRSTLGHKDGKGAGAWKEQTWQMYELVGELRYICTWLSASASRCRLVASEIDEETGRPTGSTDNATINGIVRDIAGGPGGQAQLLKRTTVFLTVPGEGWVAVISRRNGRDGVVEEWHLLDRSEIKTKAGGQIALTLADGTEHEFNPDKEVLFRIWNPHPRNSQEADSPTRSALPALMEIVQSTTTIRHAAKSRLIGGKILFVPNEMSLPKTQGAPKAASVDPDAPALPPAPEPVDAGAQDLQDMLFDVSEAAAKDPDSNAAHLPIVAGVAGEWTDKVKLVDLHSDINKEQLEIRQAAIRRVALAMDLPAEQLLGLADMNHWNAWAMREDAVATHIVPLLETIADALTTALLRPIIERLNKDEGLNLDPDKFVVWYDTTPLTQDPDRKDEARDANDRGALTNKALLRHFGFNPEEDGYDLDTADGWRQLARDKAAQNPELLRTLAPLIGVDLPELAPAPTTQEPRRLEPVRDQEPPEPADEDDIAASAEPARAVATLLLTRALELAGKRRAGRNDLAALGDIPAWQVHTRMPPADPGDVPRLIAGYDVGLTDDMARGIGVDPHRLRALVVDRARLALITARPVAVGEEIRAALR
ncbi:hypothetical protein ACPESR_25150 [Nocardia testacea]|uniref:hypothetical protein n=1 Tax=Nocardia testacea TaxID=248551 RepID=UPI003C2CECF6